jgi:hypothetical protein
MEHWLACEASISSSNQRSAQLTEEHCSATPRAVIIFWQILNERKTKQ